MGQKNNTTTIIVLLFIILYLLLDRVLVPKTKNEYTYTYITETVQKENEPEMSDPSATIYINPINKPSDLFAEAFYSFNTSESDPVEITENIDTGYFETNKVLYTVYGEDSKWGRSCASPYRDKLVSIEENTLKETINGKDIYLHSIAANNHELPFGSIIYIIELDKYFIVDDNANGSYNGIKNVQQYQTNKAWDSGCSIWIDIFCGFGTGYKESDSDWTKIKNTTGISSGMGIYHFELIRYGKE